MDVRRYLAGEPVMAAPPGASYRLATFVRRHRAAVAAGLVADFMKDVLKSVGPEVARGRDTALLKEIVRQASERIEQGELRDAPDAEVVLRTEIGGAEIDLAEYAAYEATGNAAKASALKQQLDLHFAPTAK